jgi:hypothetical protein
VLPERSFVWDDADGASADLGADGPCAKIAALKHHDKTGNSLIALFLRPCILLNSFPLVKNGADTDDKETSNGAGHVLPAPKLACNSYKDLFVRGEKEPKVAKFASRHRRRRPTSL